MFHTYHTIVHFLIVLSVILVLRHITCVTVHFWVTVFGLKPGMPVKAAVLLKISSLKIQNQVSRAFFPINSGFKGLHMRIHANIYQHIVFVYIHVTPTRPISLSLVSMTTMVELCSHSILQ